MAKGLGRVFIKTTVAAFAALALFFVVAIAAAILAAIGILPEENAYFVAVLPFAVVMMGIGLWSTVLWMRAIDEAAREAHKSAWFWGGTIGMTVGLLVVLLSMYWPGLESMKLVGLRGRDDPASYMATGAILMLAVMVIGYLVAWIVWWLRRR